MKRPQAQLWPDPEPLCTETVMADVGGGVMVLVRCNKKPGHRPPHERKVTWTKPRVRLFNPDT